MNRLALGKLGTILLKVIAMNIFVTFHEHDEIACI